MISLITSLGQIDLELDHENTPETCMNFIKYTKEGFYDNTIFHRIIPNFVIQGGGFESGMTLKKTHLPIRNEAKKALKNHRGTVAMARTSDPHSATTQFFINLKDNYFLDYTAESTEGWGYCVFAKVVNGIDVVDKMAQVQTTTRATHENVPIEDVYLYSIKS
jgi:peptidyl-prolyl cis-trans isomerase B (cyclophilin B)